MSQEATALITSSKGVFLQGEINRCQSQRLCFSPRCRRHLVDFHLVLSELPFLSLSEVRSGSAFDPHLDKSKKQMVNFLQTTFNSLHWMGFPRALACSSLGPVTSTIKATRGLEAFAKARGIWSGRESWAVHWNPPTADVRYVTREASCGQIFKWGFNLWKLQFKNKINRIADRDEYVNVVCTDPAYWKQPRLTTTQRRLNNIESKPVANNEELKLNKRVAVDRRTWAGLAQPEVKGLKGFYMVCAARTWKGKLFH